MEPALPSSAPFALGMPDGRAVPGMIDPPAVAMFDCVGDADRDRVGTQLLDHCVAGRLPLDEFSERTGAALASRTQKELAQVLADLSSAPAALSSP